ncbi:alkaline phosphatase [Actinobacillus equuli subsp. haemolyticus]|nr:alkaline phosphatase [Actinobacillus equuli subsp. haemolyticus]
MKLSKIAFIFIAAGTFRQSAIAQAEQTQSKSAKNVILLISDGAGINTWKAASYFRHGTLGKEVYDKFDVKLFASTYPLNTSTKPTHSLKNSVKFDPKSLWNKDKSAYQHKGNLTNYTDYFSGYEYAQTDFTDSAAAATALASGQKTYNNAINWSNNDTRIKNIGEYVVESGRSLGVISSVQWSHATPTGFLSHNVNRNNYAEIAQEAVKSGRASVIMGAGHPYFDQNGKAIQPTSEKDFRFVGGKETWENLVAGNTDYKLIDSKADFIALAEGKLDFNGKQKILGTAPNNATLQFNRDGVTAGNLLENQPDLTTMTLGALNVVSKNDKGFFLMVEGGAVDWAAHANNLPRLVEEQINFNLAVEAAVNWVEKNSSWNETLLIVTTDHGNGFLQGPDSNDKFYSEIINQGAGALPLVRWYSDNHTRELVPVFAKGFGAKHFLDIAKPEAGLGTYYKAAPESQFFADNTDIFRTMLKAFAIKAE